jgi:hypothetical protein
VARSSARTVLHADTSPVVKPTGGTGTAFLGGDTPVRREHRRPAGLGTFVCLATSR